MKEKEKKKPLCSPFNTNTEKKTKPSSSNFKKLMTIMIMLGTSCLLVTESCTYLDQKKCIIVHLAPFIFF